MSSIANAQYINIWVQIAYVSIKFTRVFFKFMSLFTFPLININQIQYSYFPLGLIQGSYLRACPHALLNWESTQGSEEFHGKEFRNSGIDLLPAEDYSKVWLRHLERKDDFLIAYLQNTNIRSISKGPTLNPQFHENCQNAQEKNWGDTKTKFRNSCLKPYENFYCLKILAVATLF